MNEHNDKGIEDIARNIVRENREMFRSIPLETVEGMLEEKVAEFNKIDSNDTILGNYLRIYTEFILDEADEGDRINRIQDERINNWLRQALTDIATQARTELLDELIGEEEEGRMNLELLNRAKMNGLFKRLNMKESIGWNKAKQDTITRLKEKRNNTEV